MKRILIACASVFGSVALLSSCGGDRSTLEEASFLLGKGGTAAQIRANGLSAVTKLTPLIASGDLATKFEALELYAGAKAAAAGFESIKIFSNLVYGEGDNTVNLLIDSTTLQDDAATLLDNAEDALTAFIDNTTTAPLFSSGTARQKNALYFQRGMIRLLEAFRSTLVNSGLKAARDAGTTFDPTACDDLPALTAALTDISNGLSNSRSSFVSASLTDRGVSDSNSNVAIRLVDTFRSAFTTDDVADATRLCDYINSQNNL